MRLRLSRLALLGAGLIQQSASMPSPTIVPQASTTTTTAVVGMAVDVPGSGPYSFDEGGSKLLQLFEDTELKFSYEIGCSREMGCNIKGVQLWNINRSEVVEPKSKWTWPPPIVSGQLVQDQPQNSGPEVFTLKKEITPIATAMKGDIIIRGPLLLAQNLTTAGGPPQLQFRWQVGRLQDGQITNIPSPVFGLAESLEILERYKSSFYNITYGNMQNGNGGNVGGGADGLQSPVSSTPSPTSSTQGATNAEVAGNGLSTGAIAGIAVGAGVVVLLLGTALAWFLVSRRRKNKPEKAGLGYSGGSGRSGDLVAEKEANAIVAESPRSPYSEDGHHRDSTLIGGASVASSGAAGLMAAHRHDRDGAGDYPPYSDNPSATANAPPTIASPVARAGSSTSRSTADRSSAAFPASAMPPPAIGEEGSLPPRSDTGMSGRYAHLVEDGMTADEIARLEEEERQLDVAIEQARGVTTK